MLKIVATRRNHREIVDHTFERSEAQFLLAEYALALGAEWRVEIVPTKGQDDIEKILELRRKGLSNGQIATATGIDPDSVQHHCSKLIEFGVLDRRPPGTREIYVDRNAKMIELRKQGKNSREIAAELGMNWFSVRSKLYQLRKAGKL